MKNITYVESLSEHRTVIMGWAMLLVMLLHQTWFMDFPFTIFHGMGHYGVDLFMFVSGFGIWFSLERNSVIQYYCNRLWRLLPKCIIAGVLMTGLRCCAYGIDAFSFSGLFSWNLWYIQAIVFLYLIAPLLHQLIIRYRVKLFWLLFVCSLGGLFFPLDMFPYLLTISRVPAFILGMYLANGMVRVDRQVVISSSFMLFVAILFNLFVSHHFGFWYYTFDYLILCFGLPFLSMLLIQISMVFSRGRDGGIIRWLGAHSLELYLCHECIFGVIKSSGWSSMISFFVAIILSVLTAKIIHSVGRLVSIKK